MRASRLCWLTLALVGTAATSCNTTRYYDDGSPDQAVQQSPWGSKPLLPGVVAPGSSASTKPPAVSLGSAPGQLFPRDTWFYQDISQAPLSAESTATTRWLQEQGSWGTGAIKVDYSFDVLTTKDDTPFRKFEPTADFASPDCDRVAVPVPAGGHLEGEPGYHCASGGDCHLLVVDEHNHQLFEMWKADIVGETFRGGCLVVWNLGQPYGADGRGTQCTSADAAGFPITPLLLDSDEVAAAAKAKTAINHAIRFILPNNKMRKGLFVPPASHAGAPSAVEPAPIYGSRWRLKAGFNIESLPSEGAKAVARGLQKYGMALADGGNIALTAKSDQSNTAKWSAVLNARDLALLRPTDFEVVDTGPPVALTYECRRVP